MAYIAPIHRPSSVRYAVQLNLLSPEEPTLAVAKANRIELWRTVDDVLILFHSQIVYGTVSMLERLCPYNHPTDLLFVGTDRFQYISLQWDAEKHQLVVVDEINDIGEKFLRDSQSQDRCLVDPTGKYMAMHLWEGVLTLLRLRPRKNLTLKLEPLDQVRVSELFIKSSTFLYSETGHPKIAFLYRSSSNSTDSKIATYRVTSDDKDTTASRFDPVRDRDFSMDFEDSGASLLIPVEKVEEEKRHNVRNPAMAKAHLGGLLVIGEVRLAYIDDITKTVVHGGLKNATIFVAWAKYDAVHYFLGDDYGKMYLLTILTEGDVVKGLDVSEIGRTSRASCIIYLGQGLLFVGSHYGDSQLYRVALLEGGFQLIQVIRSIAPILDFEIMDMGNRENDSQLANAYSSGQARLVTGSGVHRDGSLRSIRSGVGLEDIGILADLKDVRGLFSLHSYGTPKVDTLVVSFLTETRVFRFDSTGGIEEVNDFYGLDLSSQSLLVKNLPGGRLLQVTATAVYLLDAERGMPITTWTPSVGGSITNVSSNATWLLLAADGRELVSLNLREELAMGQRKTIGSTDQIACLHAANQLLNIGVVGFWSSGSISIVDLKTLQPLHGEALRRKDDKTSVPRDIILTQVLLPHLGGPTLFVAMDDGNVVTFNVSSSDYALSARKSVALGTRQARFHPIPQEHGIYNIITTTEHPSLIYASESRIIYSAVTAEDATYVCPFDSEAFPGAIAMATETQLKISKIDSERRTHVRTMEVNETVRRIAYSASEKLFALGCIKRELVPGDELVSSAIQLVDDMVFGKIGKPFKLDTTNGVEIVDCLIRAELPDCSGNLAERFVVGTSYLADDSTASKEVDVRGRILVFGVDSDRNPYLIADHKLKNSCHCLAVMGDKIIAGLTKAVVISKYEEESSTSARLIKLASYRPSTYAVDLAVNGNIIAVADLMKSISLVEYIPGQDGNPPELVEQARHYQSGWTTAVQHLDGNSWLEADSHGNLTVLRRNVDGVTLEDRRRMEVTSEINLGEMVNRVREIAVETVPNAAIIPKAFLATVEGSIYLFGLITPRAQDLLMRFQTRMETVVEASGSLTNFKAYRAFRNAEREGEGPFRFVDGELLERFLDLDESLQENICEGLGPSVEDVRNLVEELKRLH